MDSFSNGLAGGKEHLTMVVPTMPSQAFSAWSRCGTVCGAACHNGVPRQDKRSSQNSPLILLMSELNSNWGGTRSERIELPIPSRPLSTSSDSEHSQKNMSFLCPRSLVASTIFNIYILICEEWPQWLDAECVGGSWRRQDSDSLGNEVKWQMRHGWGVYSGKVGHMQLLEGDALTHTELLINGLGWPTKAWVWPECVLLKFRGEAVCLCLCIVILWW